MAMVEVLVSSPSFKHHHQHNNNNNDNNHDGTMTASSSSSSIAGVPVTTTSVASFLDVQQPHLDSLDEEHEEALFIEAMYGTNTQTKHQHNNDSPLPAPTTTKNKRTSIVGNVKNLFRRSTMNHVNDPDTTTSTMDSPGPLAPPPLTIESQSSPAAGSKPRRAMTVRRSLFRSVILPNHSLPTDVTSTHDEEEKDFVSPHGPTSSPLKKTLRRFIQIAPRKKDSSLPIRSSKRKDKEARVQARRDVLSRIDGALREPASISTTTSTTTTTTTRAAAVAENDDSRVFLVDYSHRDDDDDDEMDESQRGIYQLSTSNNTVTNKEHTATTKGRFSIMKQKALTFFQPGKIKEDYPPEFMAMMNASSGNFGESSTEMLEPIAPIGRAEDPVSTRLPRRISRDPEPLLHSSFQQLDIGAVRGGHNDGEEEEKEDITTGVGDHERPATGNSVISTGRRSPRRISRSTSPTLNALPNRGVDHQYVRRGHGVGRRRHLREDSYSPPREQNQRSGDGSTSTPPRARHQRSKDGSTTPPRERNQRSGDRSSTTPPRERNQRSKDGSTTPPTRARNERSKDGSTTPPTRALNERSGDGSTTPPKERSQRSGDGSTTPPKERSHQPGDRPNTPPRERNQRSGDRSTTAPPRVRYQRSKTVTNRNGESDGVIDSSDRKDKDQDNTRRGRLTRRQSQHLRDQEGVLASSQPVTSQGFLSPRQRIRRSASATKVLEWNGPIDGSGRSVKSTDSKAPGGDESKTAPRRRIRRSSSRSGEIDTSVRTENREGFLEEPDIRRRRRLRSSKSGGSDGDTGDVTAATLRSKSIDDVWERSNRMEDLSGDLLSPKTPSRSRRSSNSQQRPSTKDGESEGISTPRMPPKEDPLTVRRRMKRSNSRSEHPEKELSLRGTQGGKIPLKHTKAEPASVNPNVHDEVRSNSRSSPAPQGSSEHQRRAGLGEGRTKERRERDDPTSNIPKKSSSRSPSVRQAVQKSTRSPHGTVNPGRDKPRSPSGDMTEMEQN